MRLGSIVVLLPVLVASIAIHGPLYFLQYFTQWGIMALVVCSLKIWQTTRLELSLINRLQLEDMTYNIDPNSYTDFKICQKKAKLAYCSHWALVSQHIALTFQFGITFVFWAFVAPTFLAEASFGLKIALIFSHTVPLLWMMTNFFLTESTIRLGDWWHTFLLAAVYLMINYQVSKSQGKPVYPF